LTFEELYSLIRKTEQMLNGYTAYVCRQRAGSQEFGEKAAREGGAEYGEGDG
jgi:hypothetical protein